MPSDRGDRRSLASAHVAPTRHPFTSPRQHTLGLHRASPASRCRRRGGSILLRASSLAGAGVATRWNLNFSSENRTRHRAACIRRNEVDISRAMTDAADMTRKLLPQVVRIPVDASTAAEIRRVCSLGGRSHSKPHLAEIGRRGGLKRCEPKAGRTPMTELWRHRWRKDEMAAMRGDPVAPPGPMNPEIRCPADCGFTMIAANRVRDILNSGRAFDLTCPRCSAMMRVRRSKVRGLAGYFTASVEFLPQ